MLVEIIPATYIDPYKVTKIELVTDLGHRYVLATMDNGEVFQVDVREGEDPTSVLRRIVDLIEIGRDADKDRD